MSLDIACVVGARPNFMKMAPIMRALKSHANGDQANLTLIHTGQHYDASLSDVFFRDLGMPHPDITLEVGSGSHGVQTARVLERIEKVLIDGPKSGDCFDWLIVVGDVNSTMAASLAAAKLRIRIAHVEAGLRSCDRSMPEEVNRIVTDSISDLLLVSEPTGVQNLLREGHAADSIALVGNVMIDSLLAMLPKAQTLGQCISYGLRAGEYGVVTLHRPSNVDNSRTLTGIVEVLVETSESIPLVFPVHPRTSQSLERAGLYRQLEAARHLHLVNPLGYLEFLSLNADARLIITDSGGLQEESTALGIPCLTMRSNTERPITVDTGTSILVGNDIDVLRQSIASIIEGRFKSGGCPELWDGRAAERIAARILDR